MATLLAGVTGGFLTSATVIGGPYTQYAKTISFQQNDPGRAQIDSTTIETALPGRATVVGRNSGLETWTFNIQFDPDSTMDKAIAADKAAGTTKFYRLNWPDSDDAGVVGETWTAPGYVSGLSVTGSDNALITAQLVITLTGPVNTAPVA